MVKRNNALNGVPSERLESVVKELDMKILKKAKVPWKNRNIHSSISTHERNHDT
ncbi:unnamed protein product [Brassica oleracea var. botrytis]|uniref:(rape) hypothetical protein n=2 Tax=Brassica napus TaxID=3708 RepID=A0A078G3H0_BRANA|nr:unnamed protein product [Brassica napus]CDY19258.1 BnaC05g14590D [Brassica napus]